MSRILGKDEVTARIQRPVEDNDADCDDDDKYGWMINCREA